MMIMSYETVYTVEDFYDGPRSGFADYRGIPHHYSSNWDEKRDDWADDFTLTPVDDLTLSLALESWEIWLRWEDAFHRGQVPQDSHPGFGGKDTRYDELKVLVRERLARSKANSRLVRGLFRAKEVQRSSLPRAGSQMEVEWSDSSDSVVCL
jgi:hypothetical protein